MTDEALVLLEDLEEEALSLQVTVDSLPAIADNATFEVAAGYRARAKALIAAIKEKHGPEKKAKETVWRAAVAAEKAELEGPEALYTALNDRIGAYQTAKAREKRIAEARAAQEARKTGALVPAAAVDLPKVPGLSSIPHYDVVEDVQAGGRLALIQAVGAKKFGSPMVLEPNMQMLRDLARMAKGDLKIPGYKVVVTQRPRG